MDRTLLALCTLSSAHAFSALTISTRLAPARTRCVPLTASTLEVTAPTQEDKGKLGLLGNIDNIWLPTRVTGPFTERLPQDVTRYISEGKGTVSTGNERPIKVKTGDLVTIVDGPADLLWTPEVEMELLISEYWSPARIAARNASSFVAPALALILVAAFAYSAATSA